MLQATGISNATGFIAKNRDGHPEVYLHPPSRPGQGSAKVSNGTRLVLLEDVGEFLRVQYEGRDWHVKRHHTVQAEQARTTPARTGEDFALEIRRSKGRMYGLRLFLVLVLRLPCVCSSIHGRMISLSMHHLHHSSQI